MRDEAKAKISRRVLVYVWDSCLKLLYPFMPFLTETLWQLSPHKGDSIMISDWPQTESIKLPSDDNAIAGFKSIQSLVRAIRNARAEYNVEAGKKIGALIRIGKNVVTLKDTIDAELPILALLARLDDSLVQLEVLDSVQGVPPPEALGQCVHLVVEEGIEVYLPLSNMIDKAKELARLGKQAEKLKKDITTLENRLTSPGFLDKAPEKLGNHIIIISSSSSSSSSLIIIIISFRSQDKY